MAKDDKYILCIDGGKTNSLGAVISLKGEVLGTATGGPIAANDTKRSITSNLSSLIKGTLREGGVDKKDCLSTSVGLGSSPYLVTDRIRKIVNEVFKRLDLRGPSLVESDVKITWGGATACQPGVVAYAGTGSFSYGVNEKGNSVLVDCMGALLGDEGSGYFIGTEALKAVVKSLDGRGNKTLLKEKIFKEFEISSPINFFSKDWRSLPRERIARLSSLVDECAEGGDSVARGILEGAGRRLANYASTTIDRLGGKDLPIYCAGGVFNSQIVLDSLIQHLEAKHQLKIQKGKYDPIVGAFLLACDQLSINVSREMLSNFSANKNKLKKL